MSDSLLFERAENLLLAGEFALARLETESAIHQDDGVQARALHLLGLIDAREGFIDRALARFEKALALEPANCSWWHNLAWTHAARSDWDHALSAFERGIAFLPDDALLVEGLAQALLECGRARESLEAWQRARALGTDELSTALGVADALILLGNNTGAVEILKSAVEGSPDCIKAHRRLAEVYGAAGYFHSAREHWEHIVRRSPEDLEARAQLATVCWNNGDLQKSLELCKSLVEGHKAGPTLHSFYLSALLHDPNQTGASIRRAHEDWAREHRPASPPYSEWSNNPDIDRPLRVGYLGGDFYLNPSLYFLLPLFTGRSHQEVELFGYDIRCRADAGMEKFRQRCDHWRAAATLSVEELAVQVREDAIDILVDTTAHYSGNRIGVFQLRPAPVQVTFPNYPCTTGLDSFDAIVTDRWVCPPGLEHQYTEPVLRLPSGYLPYSPPPEAGAVSPLPALQNGFVTFGLYQRPVKITAGTWDAIAAVLSRVANSRILIHNVFPELDIAGSIMRDIYTRELMQRGVRSGRIVFRGPAELGPHLDILAEADLALDTFPYNGQTTTCECLWMGVPVITLTGTHHVARVGRTILQRVGHTGWEASSTTEYVEAAVRTARDLDRLAATRAGLRGDMRSSPMLDHRRIALELEHGYRQLWQQWCARMRRKD
jgi:predicted O-linked N-acetylglucosamine transferase (SPINDLY family)